MQPNNNTNERIDILRRKIEATILIFCIVIIVICCVYMYIVYPTKQRVKSSIEVGYEKFRTFSLPLGDTTGTEAYEEVTVREYTDDWGIRYSIKKRIK